MKIPSDEKHVLRTRLPFSYIGSFFILALLLVLSVFAVFGMYVEHWYRGAAVYVPLPAMVIGNEVVWYGEVATMAQMMHAFQAEEGDPVPEALRRVENRYQMEQLARELGVTVSREEQQDFLVDKQDLQVFMQQTGWTEDEYRRFIVRPFLVAQRVEQAVFASLEYQERVRIRIEKIQEDLDLGFDFTDLAVQRSDDLSSGNGGYLGFFSEDELPNPYQDIFQQPVSDVSEILEGDNFFAIARVYDEILGIDGREKVGLQVITIKKDGLAAALERFKEQNRVMMFVR